MNRPYILMVDLTLVLSAFLLWTTTDGEAASGILESTGTPGGVVVVVGCEKPEVLCELGENAACLVQGLDTDAHRVKMAREHIRKKGGYGRISASLFDGRNLPYAADLVNLIVARQTRKLERMKPEIVPRCPV